MPRADDRDHVGRRIDTLMQCALHRRTLRLSCRACPHVRLLDAVPVWYLFERKGWCGFLSEVPRRFYCSRCWLERSRKASAPRLEITCDPFAGAQFPYPSEREWKRFVSRYRS